jgi:hypothetical protein
LPPDPQQVWLDATGGVGALQQVAAVGVTQPQLAAQAATGAPKATTIHPTKIIHGRGSRLIMIGSPSRSP